MSAKPSVILLGILSLTCGISQDCKQKSALMPAAEPARAVEQLAGESPRTRQEGTSRLGLQGKELSKIAAAVRLMVDRCERAEDEGLIDLSVLSDAMLKVTPPGELELLLHAKSSTGPREVKQLEALGATIVARLQLPPELGLPPVGNIQAQIPWEKVEAVAELPWVVAVTPPNYGDLD